MLRASLRSCAGNAKSVALRTAALRALAHFCRSEHFVRCIGSTGVDYFVVASLERDGAQLLNHSGGAAASVPASARPPAANAKRDSNAAAGAAVTGAAVAAAGDAKASSERAARIRDERVAAFKLVLRMMEHGVEALPRSVLQSIVALAEAPDDFLRRQCLRALCQVLLRAPRLTAAANGVRTLINSILDHSLAAQQAALVGVLVHLLDAPETRQLVRTNDVALLLAPLCSTFRIRDQLSDERLQWRASLNAVVLLSRSWAGLIGMASGPVGLKAAIAALALPIDDMHDELINAFFRIFDMAPPRSPESFNIEMQLRAFASARAGRGSAHDVVRCFRAVQLLAFDAAGGLTALAAFASFKSDAEVDRGAQRRNALMRRKAAQLLAELLAFAGRNLSRSECMRLNLVPGLLNAAHAANAHGAVHSDALTVINALSEHAQLELDLTDFAGLDHALEGLPTSGSHGGSGGGDSERDTTPLATLRSPRRSHDHSAGAGGSSSNPSTLRRGKNSSLIVGSGVNSSLQRLLSVGGASSLLSDQQLLKIAVSRDNEWRRPVVSRKLERVGELRQRLDAAIDEVQFRQRVDRTHVLLYKEPWRWDWQALYDVVDGPLALHLNYALNKTKFVRRVLSFFTPSAAREATALVPSVVPASMPTPGSGVASSGADGADANRLPAGAAPGEPFAFALLQQRPENTLYLRVVCRLIEVLLLVSEAGKTMLKEHKLLKEVASTLAHEATCLKSGAVTAGDDLAAELRIDFGAADDSDESSDGGGGGGGSPAAATRATSGGRTAAPSQASSQLRLLAPYRLWRSMSRHYFTILGAVSATHRGVELMKKFQLYELLKELLENSRSDDLSSLIVTSLDYDMAGDSRLLLSSALMSSSPAVRLATLRHMRLLLRQRVQAFALWGIDLLLLGVADRERAVQREALDVIDEALDDAECADYLIGKPALVATLQALGESGVDLLLRFLTVPAGYELLEKHGFVSERLRDGAIDELNVAYARRFAAHIDAIYGDTPQAQAMRRVGVRSPRHFLGEMASSLPGCRALLANRRVLDQLAEVVREAADDIVGAVDSDDSEYAGPRFTPLQRRAALLALAHVGSSRNGYEVLKKLDIDPVALIAPLADGAASLSMRGVAYYGLCMFVGHNAGRRRLVECGWLCAEQKDAYVCIPNRTPRGTELRARLLERQTTLTIGDYESASGASDSADESEEDESLEVASASSSSSSISAEMPKPRRRRKVTKKKTSSSKKTAASAATPKKASRRASAAEAEAQAAAAAAAAAAWAAAKAAASFPAVALPDDDDADDFDAGDDEQYLEALHAFAIVPGGDSSVIDFGANGLDALNGALHLDGDRLEMLTMPHYSFTGSAADAASSDVVAAFDADDTEHRRRAHILRLVVKLSNRVVQKDAYKALDALKSKAPNAFTSPYLLFQIFKLFETYRFPLEQRRQVHALFGTVSFNNDEFFKDFDRDAHDLVFYNVRKVEDRLALDDWDDRLIKESVGAADGAPGATAVE